MEKNSGFGFHLSNNMNLNGFPNTGCLNTVPVFTNPPYVVDSTMRNIPPFLVPGVHQSYGTPCFNQAFVPSVFNKDMLPTGPTPAQKRFLVFDQTGDKTTMIYTSALQTPVQFGSQWVPPNLPNPYISTKNMNDEYIEENSRDITEEDEMHENTEELNALLSSDNYTDDYSEDDEETSTGHSPSAMTENGVRDLTEEEEVNSFSWAEPTKKRKLLNGGPASSSLKASASSALEDDDAVSSCGNNNSWTGGQRLRKEKIRKTVSVLQRIIPSANEKDDAVAVIDEAIKYLRFLKVKAKDFGLDSL